MKHPFTSGLATASNQYKNLANQLNTWEENNQAIYKFETDRLQKMTNTIAANPQAAISANGILTGAPMAANQTAPAAVPATAPVPAASAVTNNQFQEQLKIL